MKEKKNVPELRFPEFTEPWKKYKVDDAITEVSRPIKLEDNKMYQLVTVKRRNEGIISRGNVFGRDILVKRYFEVHSGDYLISKRQLVHGGNGIVPKSLNNAVVSNEYMICVSNEIILAEFLALLSKTRTLKRDFFLSSYGVDIEKLVFDVQDWKKRSLTLPSLNEQRRICNYFQKIDKIIDLHQRKHNILKALKKSMLQKIFSQELRFKDDNGQDFSDWEEKKLSELFPFIRNGFVGTIAPFYTDKEHGIRYLQGTNIHDGQITDETEFYVTKEFNSKHAKNILKSDDILVVQSGHVGDCVVVGNKYAGSNCHALIIMSNGGECNSQFMCYYLHSERAMYDLNKITTGNTIKHILASDMKNFKVIVPSISEQNKIADYFTHLDALITAEQEKLAALQKMKKGFLQKMFV